MNQVVAEDFGIRTSGTVRAHAALVGLTDGGNWLRALSPICGGTGTRPRAIAAPGFFRRTGISTSD